MHSLKVTLTMKQLQRFQTIQSLLDRRLTNAQAANALNLSVRRIQRLKVKVRTAGPGGVLHGNAGRPPAHAKPPALREKVISLATTPYAHYHFSPLADTLADQHHIRLSDETLRRWLRPLGHGKPLRRQHIHRRRRCRSAREGQRLFLDGSPHPWFGNDYPPICLLLAGDDATGIPLVGKFQPQEDRNGCFEVCYHLFRRFGLPAAFYLDRASQFITTDHRAQKQGITPPPTHLQQAMETLAIHLIFANSPQARGRGERLNGSFQGRLAAELQRYHIHTGPRATQYLNEVFIPKYVSRFRKSPADPTAAWRPTGHLGDLRTILCAKLSRTVANDNTVSVNGACYQLEPPSGRFHLTRAKIESQQWFDQSLHFVHPRYGPLVAKPVTARPRPQPQVAQADVLW